MTMVGEKAVKVYFKAVLGASEAYFFKQKLVADLACVPCKVNAAKVNKIKCASAHNKERVGIVFTKGGSDIAYLAALIGKPELADARKFIVNGHGVCQQVCVVFNAAFLAKLSLHVL